MKLNHDNILSFIQENAGNQINFYGQSEKHFYRYVVDYNINNNQMTVKKYILTTSELVVDAVINFSCMISVYDSSKLPQAFEDVFENDLIYFNLNSMITYVVHGIKENTLESSHPSIQELIDLYPEAFI